MVKKGQPEILPVDFTSRQHPETPVEVIERSELMSRSDLLNLPRAQRPTFDLFLVPRSYTGTHRLDFADIPVLNGRLIRVRPGQVQQWDLKSDFEASLILSRHNTDAPGAWFPGDSPYRDIEPESWPTVAAIVDALRREQARFVATEPSIRLMTALFASLCAVFDRAASDAQSGALPKAFAAFRSAIEVGLSRSHRVSDHVAELGYSQRTVDRACRRATGRSAKAILDERLALEAKRLLAHTDKPAATIASELGFSEPTNFHKFFVRVARQRPGEFRQASRDS